MKKLSIIGAAGGIGSSMAFQIGLASLFSEMFLMDKKENVLESHVIDMRECFSRTSSTKVYKGSRENLSGSDLVIVTAAAPPFKVNSRSDYLTASLSIITDTALAVKEHCPEALVLVASAPVDVFAAVFHHIIGGDRHKIMGFSLNDSWRFAWAVSEVLGMDGRRLRALVLGEHGETQVPLYSQLLLDGEPLRLKDGEKAKVARLLRDWYPAWQALEPGRTTTWTSAAAMLHLLENIENPKPDLILPSSAALAGEYGFSGLSLGMPLLYGRAGWREMALLDLNDEEKEGLDKSAAKVTELLAMALDQV